MVLNVSTRKYHRAVRLPEGDLAKARATAPRSRPFPGALWRCHARRLAASDLSERLCMGDHVLMAAIGVDGGDRMSWPW